MTAAPEQELAMDGKVSCPNCHTRLAVFVEEYTISAEESTIKLGVCREPSEEGTPR